VDLDTNTAKNGQTTQISYYKNHTLGEEW